MNLYEVWIESYRIRIPGNVQMFPALPTGQWSWRSGSQFYSANLPNLAQIALWASNDFNRTSIFAIFFHSFDSFVFFESQLSCTFWEASFVRFFFGSEISWSAGPFSGLVKMGLLKEQEIPYLADRAQRLDMQYTAIHAGDPQRALNGLPNLGSF